MRQVLKVIAVLVGLQLGWQSAAFAHGTPSAPGPILRADPSYDERTVIAPSRIPGSGNGLYAKVKIKAGEVIGELGGQLVEEPDLAEPSAYLAGLPDCAMMQLAPYRYIDSKDNSGHVSRANFAPSTINGIETGFQNAKIERVCYSPYVVFVATKDIEPGSEIWASYGPSYGYSRFMDIREVKDFFCGLLAINCRDRFEYDH